MLVQNVLVRKMIIIKVRGTKLRQKLNSTKFDCPAKIRQNRVYFLSAHGKVLMGFSLEHDS